jgi:glutaredoxin 3
MRHVKMYVIPSCPYCVRAKDILKKHNVAFEEIDVAGDKDRRRWLVEQSGQTTVPQIFFGEQSIGGCSDLEVIVKAGRLQGLLA